MAKRIRFLMVGGFLGAGKTTTLGRLARIYRERGLNVGIVTNDQAANLVDTQLLRAQGHRVGEVAGACFCCSFNDLTSTIERLGQDERPDVILAEPVGSCTDLVATVAQPLMRLYGERFDVGPYAVIVKPSHGRKILEGVENGGFSPKAEYIFRKQLEEADLLLINRIDELEPANADRLEHLLRDAFGERPVLRVSARDGEGFDQLVAALETDGQHCRRILDLDYDVYAEGEAELGWLNANIRLTATQPFALDDLLLRVTDTLRASLAAAGAEPAHLKSIGLADGAYGVANLISSDTPAALSLPSHAQTATADLVVNARVATDPDTLREQVEAAIRSAARESGAAAEIVALQSFRPGRPVPTHRFAK
jgi:Ni2+-binding GTPase involved in maturation of urease and hydrogenase